MHEAGQGGRRRAAGATGVVSVVVLVVATGAASLELPPPAQPAAPPAGEVVEVADSATEEPAATATCGNASDGVELAYPADWHHTGEDGGQPCRAFAPEPFDAGSPQRSSHDAAIYLDTLAVEFATHVTETVDADGADHAQIVDRGERRTDEGREAVRYETVATGEGFYAEGTRVTHWVIDLDGRTVRLHTDDATPWGDYDRNVAVLDSMAASVTDR